MSDMQEKGPVLGTAVPPVGHDGVKRKGASPREGTVLGFLVGFLVGLQPFMLPLNVAVVDPLLLLLFASRLALAGRTEGWFGWAAPWLWLIAFGSFAGMLATPFLADSLLHLLRDAYAFAIAVVAVWWVRQTPTRWRAVMLGMLAVGCVCAGLIIVSPETRPSGTFLNPNYAGHFLAVVVVLLLALWRSLPRWVLLTLPLLLAGVVGTASFGAFLILSCGAAVVGWNLGQGNRGARFLVRALLIGVVAAVAATGVVGTALESDYAADNGLGEYRLEKTSTGRVERYSIGLEMAAEHPFGVGPGGAVHLESALLEHELHNDYLAFLVERSAIALVGLVGLLLGMWRRFHPGGAARAILVMLAAGSLVRETLNFRHLWLAIALALVFDALRDRDPQANDRTGLEPVRAQGLIRRRATS